MFSGWVDSLWCVGVAQAGTCVNLGMIAYGDYCIQIFLVCIETHIYTYVGEKSINKPFTEEERI